MKKLILSVTTLLFSNLICQMSPAAGFHFPEERYYTPRIDTGYDQYATPSLHYTNQYVLTFDDGPHPVHTPKILDTLKKYGVKATFFINTINLSEKTFPIFKRILDEGHIAASHGHEHLNHNKVDRNEFRINLKRSIEKLQEFHQRAGYKMNHSYFRFPYAAYGKSSSYHHMNIMQEVAKELYGRNCMQFVFWDIDSGDWIPGLSQSELLQNIKVAQYGGRYTSYQVVSGKIYKKEKTFHSPLSKEIPTTEGGVILFHDIQKRTAEGLSGVLDYMQENQLQVVPLSEITEFSYANTGCFEN